MGVIGHQWERFRNYLYDTFVVAMTSVWYREFLVRLPPDSVVLDVGIGNATSLINNRDIIVSKRLKIHGVDYDQGYIDAARSIVNQYQLDKCITLECCSIHDFQASQLKLPASGDPNRVFDAIYFSGSFMIIPEKEKALRSVVAMLKNPASGRVCFTQTFEKPGLVGVVMSYLKPFFKYILTIDFGGVTYEKDFRTVLSKSNMSIETFHTIHQGKFRGQFLVVAKPALEQ